MTLTLTLLGVVMATMVTLGPQNVPIHHVSRTVDPAFESRYQLCPGAPYEGGVDRSNDTRASVEELFGPITSIEIHQFGPKFANFSAVETYVRELLAKRPRRVSRFQSWANSTALDRGGVLGTIRFGNGVSGVFDATGPDVCLEDAMSRHWWLRLVPMDVW
jgi:hypothetical protein